MAYSPVILAKEGLGIVLRSKQHILCLYAAILGRESRINNT
jgi:hypothetical protein